VGFKEGREDLGLGLGRFGEDLEAWLGGNKGLVGLGGGRGRGGRLLVLVLVFVFVMLPVDRDLATDFCWLPLAVGTASNRELVDFGG
jgi:hypothetical protein